jgi:hypothetical protein
VFSVVRYHAASMSKHRRFMCGPQQRPVKIWRSAKDVHGSGLQYTVSSPPGQRCVAPQVDGGVDGGVAVVQVPCNTAEHRRTPRVYPEHRWFACGPQQRPART